MPNLNVNFNFTASGNLKWEYRGKDKGFFCPACGSGCLLNYESDFFPSDYCPHCGQKLEKPDDGWSPYPIITNGRTIPKPLPSAWEFD